MWRKCHAAKILAKKFQVAKLDAAKICHAPKFKRCENAMRWNLRRQNFLWRNLMRWKFHKEKFSVVKFLAAKYNMAKNPVFLVRKFKITEDAYLNYLKNRRKFNNYRRKLTIAPLFAPFIMLLNVNMSDLNRRLILNWKNW